MKCQSGIYKFENISNGKVYVGSASYLGSRRRSHLRALRSGTHYNTKLQRAWNKHGPDCFVYSVIEFVEDKSTLRSREQYWMDLLNAVAGGYNILPFAGSMFSFKMSAEAKAKISAKNKGKKRTPEQCEAIRARATGRRQTPEQAKRHSEFMMGRKPSAAHLAAQVIGIRSPATRAKISAAGKGRVKSAEHMEKIRAALARPEVKEKLSRRSRAQPGRSFTQEQRAELAERVRARWADPKMREKYILARRANPMRPRKENAQPSLF